MLVPSRGTHHHPNYAWKLGMGHGSTYCPPWQGRRKTTLGSDGILVARGPDLLLPVLHQFWPSRWRWSGTNGLWDVTDLSGNFLTSLTSVDRVFKTVSLEARSFNRVKLTPRDPINSWRTPLLLTSWECDAWCLGLERMSTCCKKTKPSIARLYPLCTFWGMTKCEEEYA